MKNIKDYISIPVIILLALALIFAAWGAYQSKLAKEIAENNITDVSPEKLDNVKDGTQVCVSGKLTVVNAPVVKGMDYTTDALVIIKTVEMYQYEISEDTVVKQYVSYSVSDIGGRGGEKYTNPEFPLERSATYFADVSFGGKTLIDEDYVFSYINGYSQSFEIPEAIAIDDIEIEGFTYDKDDDYYYKNGVDPSSPKIGDVRIKYEYVPVPNGEITVCGTVSDGKITNAQTGSEFVKDSAASVDEVIGQYAEEHSNSAGGFYLFSFINIAIAGVIVFIKMKKKGGINK